MEVPAMGWRQITRLTKGNNKGKVSCSLVTASLENAWSDSIQVFPEWPTNIRRSKHCPGKESHFR